MKPHHAPGFLPTLAMFAIVSLIMFVDRRRQRRADGLNEDGRCARCARALLEPGHRVPVSGGPLFLHTAFVCTDCFVVVRRHERIVYLFLGLALLVALVMTWRNG